MIDITPQGVVIKTETEHQHTGDKAQVNRCEFTAGQFRPSLPFPTAIDATTARSDDESVRAALSKRGQRIPRWTRTLLTHCVAWNETSA